jgi:hypothetical protein
MSEKKDEEEEAKGYTVKDKRAFSPSGEIRDKEEEGKASEKDEKTEVKGKEDQREKPKGKREEKTGDIPLPEVNFANFIFSLSTSAFFYLGEAPDPVSEKKEDNLSLAKHVIDTIGMLKEKTEGNLTEDEKTLIEKVLYDLRMKYVKKVKE